MTDISIKALTKQDNLQQIVDLFNILYPQRPIKKDYLLWRYINSPYKSMTYLAKDINKIIGTYSGSIFPGIVQGKKGKIGFLYDLMVDPKYQNRGLALPLYNSLLRFMTNENPDFLYCFVNSRLLPLYTKYLKWILLKEVPLYSSQIQRVNKALKNLIPKPITIKYASGVPRNITKFTIMCYQSEQIYSFILRSNKLLHWRIKQIFGKKFKLYNFTSNGTLIGFCILKFFDDKKNKRTVADLIDIVVYPKHFFYSILYLVCEIIKRSNVYNITTLGFGQISNRELIKLGFQKSGVSWNLLSLSINNSVDTNFYVNMLDTEMF